MGAEVAPPSAPIHLDDALDPGRDLRDWLELRIKLFDGSDGSAPSVDTWDLQFSCVEF
jgi:hypothetical protein